MAQPVTPAEPAAERRLSPEQIEAVLAEAAKRREAAEAAVPEDVGPVAKSQPHGEFGLSVGTGGYRKVFGTGVYPLGDDGTAAISMDYLDSGKRPNKR